MKTEMEERLESALESLTLLRDAARMNGNHDEVIRLNGKAEGIMLALSYEREEKRLREQY